MIKIDEKYLDKIINNVSRTLVGRIMKRFEISGNEDRILKKNVKELIYEHFRDLKNFLIAYSEGINCMKILFEETKEVRDE